MNIILALSSVGSFIVLSVVPRSWQKLPITSTFTLFSGAWQSLLLVGIAIDRHIAIIRPLHYVQLVTCGRLVVYVCVSGLGSILIASVILLLDSPTYVQASTSHPDGKLTLAMLFGEQAMWYMRLWLGLQFLLGILIVCLYRPVLQAIGKQLSKEEANSTTSSSNNAKP